MDTVWCALMSELRFYFGSAAKGAGTTPLDFVVEQLSQTDRFEEIFGVSPGFYRCITIWMCSFREVVLYLTNQIFVTSAMVRFYV
jgi:hypothetical protein